MKCKKYIGYHLRRWFSNQKENCSITINLEIELYKLPLYKGRCPELVPNKVSALLISDRYLRKYLHKVDIIPKATQEALWLTNHKTSKKQKIKFHIISLLLAF